jgi:hypothetical protein
MRRVVQWGFVAGTHYANLAERLAHRFDGVAMHVTKGRIRIEQLVVLADSTELDVLAAQVDRVDAGQIRVLAIEADPLLLSRVFPDVPITTLTDVDPAWLWQAALEACSGSPGVLPGRRFPRVFLSHAVADEGSLVGAIEYLRRVTQSPFFLCGDSIGSGEPWQPRILTQLGQAERLLFVLSEASSKSTFCAFEVGQAMAREIPIGLVAIDDTPPPAYLQHLQVIQVSRLHALRPWLSKSEVLIEALILGCGGAK